MAENALTSIVTQVGIETTYGTSVAAANRYVGININPKAMNESNVLRAEGYANPVAVVPTKEWTEADVNILPDFNAMPLALSMAFKKNVTPTTVGTLGKLWTFDPVDFGCRDDVNSLTVERGNCFRAIKASGMVMTEYGMSLSRSDISYSGKVIGQRLVDDSGLSTGEVQTLSITGSPTGGTFTVTFNSITSGAIPYNATASAMQTIIDTAFGLGNMVIAGGPLPATPVTITYKNKYGQTNVALMTTTNSFTGGSSPNTTVVETTPGSVPTEVPIVAMNPNSFDMWLDDTAAGLGTTLVARNFNMNWKVTGLRGPLWPIGTANQSFAAAVESTPSHAIDFTLGADNEGMALLNTYRNGAKKFMRVKGVGPLIETGVPYFFQLDMCILLSKTVDYTDQDGVVKAAKWSGEVAHDSTWARALMIKVQNAKATL